MSDPQHSARVARPAVRPVVAVALVLAGLALWGLYRVLAGGGPYAYAPGATAPDTVTLRAGSIYRIEVPGGQSAAADAFTADKTIACTLTTTDGQVRTVSAVADSTKATNALASFVSPVSGTVRIDCTGLTAVFVAGDDTPFDTSGLLLVLAIIALAVGLPLALSTLRNPTP